MRSKSIFVLATVVFLFSLEPINFASAATLQGLGYLPGGSYSKAYDVSSDGAIVVGASHSSSGERAVVWSQDNGLVAITEGEGVAFGVSGDGSVVVGYTKTNSTAFRWTQEDGLTSLDFGANISLIYGASADGSILAGEIRSHPVYGRKALVWSQEDGLQLCDDITGADITVAATDISADGLVATGYSSGNNGFRWTESEGSISLGHLPGRDRTQAYGISPEGSYIVGFSMMQNGDQQEAFRWDEEDGIIGLGTLGGTSKSQALDVSANGSVVVGWCTATDWEAVIWTPETGMLRLEDFLVNEFNFDLNGWDLLQAQAISDDGTTIVGFGRNPAGRFEGWIATIPAPTAPPIADANGPDSIYVGDTLTLDASGSTDADDDIVSYMWDLDDDGIFETDASGEAILDVNYAYLQSLGLLVNNTYNIYLQVTDSEGQSDTNDTALTILPKPAFEVAVAIRPGSCPNPLNVKSSGVLPVAILGSEDLDVNTIDVASIELAGVGVVRHSFEDVATSASDINDCNCTEDGPDGFTDLTLKFLTQDIVEAIGDVNHGDVLPLELTGVLFGERPIEGADCIVIRGRHRLHNRADINKDGKVDLNDFAIFSENWLQSSIVDE